MTKIDIVSGFLGAGKTTLIKKLLAEAFPGEKLVLIENEFGEISIDGGFLKESGVQISEMSAGCICCSLVGDFHKALKDVQAQFHPDRILIEPSGVGKLSDVIVAVQNTADETDDMKLNSFVTVADATKVKVYMKNFGEFYNNQIEAAGTIILSRTQKMSQEKLEAAVAMLREKNADAAILTTPWDQLDGKTILPLQFAMSRDAAVLRASHETAASAVRPFLDSGQDVAMLNLGDVSIYATFGYLQEILQAQGYTTAMAAGVPSFCAAAARLNQPLTGGMDAPLTIAPGSRADEVLDAPGTKVLMKTGRQLPALLDTLDAHGALSRSALVCSCGLPDETIFPDLSTARPPQDGSKAGYFATVLVKE